jgi:preprotein translocase subunit SecF
VQLPFGLPEVDYSEYSNRQLAAVPLAVLLAALVVIGGFWAVTGAPVEPGIAFTGGTEMRVTPTGDQAREELQNAFETPPESIQSVPSDDSFIVTFGNDVAATAVEEQAQQAGFEVGAVDDVSGSFGQSAQIQAIGGVIVAFGGMSVLVFAMFRSFVPSIAVVLSAFSDIVVPVALMNLFGIELTLGSVAALLMLIGYSVDSDILLNNHVIRRSGGFYESAYSAMQTGITMTLTSIAAMTAMTIVAALFGIELLSSIGLILVFGLVTDLMNTYLLNMSLLRWWKFEGVGR